MSDKTVPLLAQLIAGLAVPLSLTHEAGNFLGAGRQPLLALRSDLNLFGYPSSEEIEQRIREALASQEPRT
jgi:hypothetical protein